MEWLCLYWLSEKSDDCSKNEKMKESIRSHRLVVTWVRKKRWVGGHGVGHKLPCGLPMLKFLSYTTNYVVSSKPVNFAVSIKRGPQTTDLVQIQTIKFDGYKCWFCSNGSKHVYCKIYFNQWAKHEDCKCTLNEMATKVRMSIRCCVNISITGINTACMKPSIFNNCSSTVLRIWK